MGWIWISKVYNRIKPKVSVPWHWNLINEITILLPRDGSNIFTKAMFSFSDIIKIVSDK